MNRENKIKSNEIKKAALLMSRLIEFDSDVEKDINGYISRYGITYFFNNLETFELSSDIIFKLQALRVILFGFEKLKKQLLIGGELSND